MFGGATDSFSEATVGKIYSTLVFVFRAFMWTFFRNNNHDFIPRMKKRQEEKHNNGKLGKAMGFRTVINAM